MVRCGVECKAHEAEGTMTATTTALTAAPPEAGTSSPDTSSPLASPIPMPRIGTGGPDNAGGTVKQILELMKRLAAEGIAAKRTPHTS